MRDIDKLKAAVAGEVGARYEALADLSRKIHDNPETAFKEKKAAAHLTAFLEGEGFQVTRGIAKLPTAFRADYGEGRPVIAYLAEYDALPKLGHACGHNLIATASVAAGVAAKRAVDELGGAVRVFGTPGEELLGGKGVMAERGAFEDIDLAMITHPGGGHRVVANTLACQTLDIEFAGRAAHAAAEPEAGVNALEAMIQSYNAINSLRQHIREKERVHGVITDGGEAANIVPAHTAANFIVRAETDDRLEALKERVLDCFRGAAIATGAELNYKWSAYYAAMISNMTLARLFKKNLEALGRRIPLGDASLWAGSTDVGNVSRLVPTVQPLVGIAPESVLLHSPDFAAAANTGEALDAMLDAARAMAMTAVDILAGPEVLAAARDEWDRAAK